MEIHVGLWTSTYFKNCSNTSYCLSTEALCALSPKLAAAPKLGSRRNKCGAQEVVHFSGTLSPVPRIFRALQILQKLKLSEAFRCLPRPFKRDPFTSSPPKLNIIKLIWPALELPMPLSPLDGKQQSFE